MNFPLGIGFTREKHRSSSATDLRHRPPPLVSKGTIILPQSNQSLFLLFNAWSIFVTSSTANYPTRRQQHPDVLIQDSLHYQN